MAQDASYQASEGSLFSFDRLSDEAPAAAASGRRPLDDDDDGEDLSFHDDEGSDGDGGGGAAATAGGPPTAGQTSQKPAAWRGGASVFSEEGVGIDRLDAWGRKAILCQYTGRQSLNTLVQPVLLHSAAGLVWLGGWTGCEIVNCQPVLRWTESISIWWISLIPTSTVGRWNITELSTESNKLCRKWCEVGEWWLGGGCKGPVEWGASLGLEELIRRGPMWGPFNRLPKSPLTLASVSQHRPAGWLFQLAYRCYSWPWGEEALCFWPNLSLCLSGDHKHWCWSERPDPSLMCLLLQHLKISQ